MISLNAIAEGPSENPFLRDLTEGLGASPKTLPCKYFYDERGSRLFEEICDLEEYYLTRTEMAILEEACPEIASLVPGGVSLIEPGAGAGRKAMLLLNELESPRRFVPLEISSEALRLAGNTVRENCPELELLPLLGDFTDATHLSRLPQIDGPRLIFFPGSTIGNFPPEDAVQVLRNLARLAGPRGFVVVGYDRLKAAEKLELAYNDSLGVTAEFNKNILVRANRELGANFDLEAFAHSARFNPGHSRVEMHLVSLRSQLVRVGASQFTFVAGESIHTENSHKYSPEAFARLAQAAGLRELRYWSDENDAFALSLLSPSPG